MNWETGIDMYTLMCIKWMTNKKPLYKKKKKRSILKPKHQTSLSLMFLFFITLVKEYLFNLLLPPRPKSVPRGQGVPSSPKHIASYFRKGIMFAMGSVPV